MKKNKFYLGAASMLLTGMLAACSADDPKADGGAEIPDDGGKVYMTIDITSTTPDGTRSSTTDKPDGNGSNSSEGSEVGQDSENKISNIMVLLVGRDAANNDHCLIAKYSKDLTATDISGSGTQIGVEFSKSALLQHYEAHKTGSSDYLENPENIHVYVICNYTTEIANSIPTPGTFEGTKKLDWLNNVVSISSYSSKGSVPYWKENKFLMTNSAKYESEIPSKDDIEKGTYSSSNPFKLYEPKGTDNGPVTVERAVARLDYAPQIEGSSVLGDKTNGYYYETSSTEDVGIKVTLERMALVNMSKQFYLFRRVSDDGSATGMTICGIERGEKKDDSGTITTKANYVVDPEWSWKSNLPTLSGTESEINNAKNAFKNRFFYWVNTTDRFTQEDGGEGPADDGVYNRDWDNYDIAKVIAGDNKDKEDKYYIWRYITPNTIPGENTQRAGISTGVVFKAKFEVSQSALTSSNEAIKTAAKKIDDAMKAENDIFAFNGKLIGKWNDVVTLAETTTNADLKAAFDKVIAANPALAKDGADANKDTYDANLTETIVKTGGFAKYAHVANGGGTSGGGYFCYYYYWNRHNNNGNNSKMGPMEFAVVRNNIYKLAVTKITRLGHPFRPGNDPDPVDPNDPDEDEKVYMEVKVKVKPWTKRVNNIEF